MRQNRIHRPTRLRFLRIAPSVSLHSVRHVTNAFATVEETHGGCYKCVLNTLPLAFLDHVQAFSILGGTSTATDG
jgi:hypothetical protein